MFLEQLNQELEAARKSAARFFDAGKEIYIEHTQQGKKLRIGAYVSTVSSEIGVYSNTENEGRIRFSIPDLKATIHGNPDFTEAEARELLEAIIARADKAEA